MESMYLAILLCLGGKLLDICRALPEAGGHLRPALEGDRLVIKSGRSRFVLSTLPAVEFPVIDDIAANYEIELEQSAWTAAGENTLFNGSAGRSILPERSVDRGWQHDTARCCY